MKKSKQPSASDAVMKQIKRGNVAMRPHTYFVLLSVISVVAISVAAFVFSYCLSILFFWTRILFADTPAWGARANLSDMTSNFPWWAVLVAAAMFTLAVWLIRRQGHLYRYKTSVIIGWLAFATIIVGVMLSVMGIGREHGPGNPPIDHNQQPGWQRTLW